MSKGRAGAIVISAKAQEWIRDTMLDGEGLLVDINDAISRYNESQRYAGYTPEQIAALEAKYESRLASIQAAKK